MSPPSPPASPTVVRPISFALAKAASRFSELPLVEKPMRPSPGRAWASSWRTKMCFTPTSLATALTMAWSITRFMAGRAGRPAVMGCWNSTAKWAASQEDPPLPMENILPPPA